MRGRLGRMRTLPLYIEFRRDRITSSWHLVCRACGIKESYRSFWPASHAAHAHADLHEAEEEGAPCTSAGVPG
jgi:hypothetical protein